MIAAIFVVPLIYFINAFLFGRLIKKWKININSLLATLVGFVAFMDIIYFLSIWLYASKATVWTYFIIFGIIQSLLLFIYIANWRYIFITWSVDYKKIITFAIVFGLTIVICLLNFRDFNSYFGQNWYYNFCDKASVDIWKAMWFGTSPNDVLTGFSACNILNLFWINVFNVADKTSIIGFCNWSWSIIIAGFAACLTTWLISKNTSIPRMIGTMFICLLFVVLILVFIESFAVGDAWVLMLLFAYVLVMVKENNSQSLKLFSMTTLLIGFLAFSSTSCFTVICVWIFSMYFVIRNKENSINFALFLTWPLFLSIASLLSFYTFPLLSVIAALYLAVVIVTVLIIRKTGTPSWDTKFALKIYTNSGKIVYAGLIIFIALILMANFFIFQEIYHWNGANIDYKNFLTFTYNYVWSYDITTTGGIASFNTAMYVVFVAITITYLVLRKLKNHKLYYLCKQDFAIKFGIVSCILFINPLVIHVLKISTSSFPLNTLDLNMLFVVPIFVLILKIITNYKINPINNWKYNWY